MANPTPRRSPASPLKRFLGAAFFFKKGGLFLANVNDQGQTTPVFTANHARISQPFLNARGRMTRVMTRKFSKTQFKARALELFREVEATGTPLILTDRGAPVLEIRPYRPRLGDPLEALRGSVRFFAPPADED